MSGGNLVRDIEQVAPRARRPRDRQQDVGAIFGALPVPLERASCRVRSGGQSRYGREELRRLANE